MKLLGIALAMMVAQSSELPGAADATFEQRWEAMVIKHQLKRYEKESQEQRRVDAEVEDRPSRHHRERHHRHRANGKCRFGHAVYRGRSWRCRR